MVHIYKTSASSFGSHQPSESLIALTLTKSNEDSPLKADELALAL